jgi:hypothetical protein
MNVEMIWCRSQCRRLKKKATITPIERIHLAQIEEFHEVREIRDLHLVEMICFTLKLKALCRAPRRIETKLKREHLFL